MPDAAAPAVDPRIWRTVGAPLVGGAGRGPLAGERVAVKDLFAVAGHPVGGGVPRWLAEAAPEQRNATAVQQLLDAGADVTGIARTDEFAYSIAGANPHYGTPPNAAVPGALPGGSSSGPASAVALGQATVGLGTDTGGSIRVPASYQGLWGLRTTHGAVPVDGLLPLAPRFDTVGWLTRDPGLLQRVAEVALGPGAPSTPPRLAVAPALLAELDDGVRAAFEHALAGAVTEGAVEPPDEAELPDAGAAFEAFRVLQAREAWRVHGPWLEAHPDAVRGAVAQRFAVAARVTDQDVAAAETVASRVRERVRDLLTGCVLVLPSAASPAPPALADDATADRARSRTLRLTCFAGLAGAPAVSAPLAAVGGGPLGVCLVGAPGTDVDLVRLASRLAAAV